MLISFVTRLILNSVFPQSLGHVAVFVFPYFRLWHDFEHALNRHESDLSVVSFLWLIGSSALDCVQLRVIGQYVEWSGLWVCENWLFSDLSVSANPSGIDTPTAQTWSSATILTSSLSFILLRWSSVSLSTFCVWPRDWRTPWISPRVCPPARSQELVTTTSLLVACPASRFK